MPYTISIEEVIEQVRDKRAFLQHTLNPFTGDVLYYAINPEDRTIIIIHIQQRFRFVSNAPEVAN